jgi:hypothetical protein
MVKIFFSPLIVIVTGPEGDSFCLTNNNNVTNNSVTNKKAATVAIMVPVVPAANIISLSSLYLYF